MQRVPDEIWDYFIKTIVPAFLAVTISIAVKMEEIIVDKKKIILSYIIGIGFACLVGQIIIEKVPPWAASSLIGSAAYLGRPFVKWLTKKIDSGEIGSIFDIGFDYLKKKLKDLFK